MYEIKSHSKKTLLMKKAKNLTSHSNTDQIQTPHALAALPLPSSLAKTKQNKSKPNFMCKITSWKRL